MELEAGVNDKGELVAFIRVLGEYDGDKVMMSVTGEANINVFIRKLQLNAKDERDSLFQ